MTTKDKSTDDMNIFTVAGLVVRYGDIYIVKDLLNKIIHKDCGNTALNFLKGLSKRWELYDRDEIG